MGKPRGFGKGHKSPSNDEHHGAQLLQQALAIARQNFEVGRYSQAAGVYQHLLLRWPQQAEALHGLGMALHLLGETGERAARLVGQATRLKPDFAQAHYHLGLILASQQRFAEAVPSYRRAIALQDDHTEAHLSLGYALEALQQLAQAAECYRRAIALDPRFAEAHYNLGNVLRVQGAWKEAIASYHTALAVRPDHVGAWNNLAHLFDNQGEAQQAVACFRQALALAPNLARLHTNLGTVLEDQGQTEEALACFERALQLEPHCAPALWQMQLCLPVLYCDPAEIPVWHARFSRNLEALIGRTRFDTSEGREAALAGASCQVNFYLQYQGIDDTALQRRYGEFVHRVMVANFPQWAHCGERPRRPGAKIRLGYVSSYILSHSGTRWVLGWLKNHDRSKFEIYCYHTGQEVDGATEQFDRTSDIFRHIPESLEAACRQIRDDGLDVLIYPDIGMEPKTTLMAALRLAPVQCGAWGHPVTTGLPTIDYFFSGEAMEPDHPQRYYTEKLVLLPRIGVCYTRPPLPAEPAAREHFALEAEQVVYLSCQSLFKYLPQYDYIFAAIARQVPRAVFVFVAHPSPHVSGLFEQRLQRAFAASGLDSRNHCRLLPRQSYTGYLHLLQVSDVFLDTFDFSGGNTSLEALAFALPTVTCPKAFMRGRLTYAMLKVAGIEQTIARDEAEYIAIAARLGRQPDWRRQIAQMLAERSGGLFEDRSCVGALEQFLVEVTSAGWSPPA
ncbi:MAG: tetratricopeptide repeat protein [Aphanocapsa lilacina HA4352-LM1]|jgi:predicted O-linked N-acetylglucosamine transferase (SPINDLY family)|nr:tetratricopeptide repeat protein [Aphanocapsa lilacina HA4352-LM1]